MLNVLLEYFCQLILSGVKITLICFLKEFFKLCVVLKFILGFVVILVNGFDSQKANGELLLHIFLAKFIYTYSLPCAFGRFCSHIILFFIMVTSAVVVVIITVLLILLIMIIFHFESGIIIKERRLQHCEFVNT